jgi:hypothetical protein
MLIPDLGRISPLHSVKTEGPDNSEVVCCIQEKKKSGDIHTDSAYINTVVQHA